MLTYPYSKELLQHLRTNDKALVSLCITDIPPNEINKFMSALRMNTILASLNLSSNKIYAEGAKALARHTTLTSLNLSSNTICGPEGAKAFARNTTLTSLDLAHNTIGTDGAKALALNTTLTSLNLHDNRILDEGAKALACNTTLTWLNLDNSWIHAEGAKALALNTTLTSLNLSSNWGIHDEGANALALNAALKSLNLGGNGIGAEGARTLALNATLASLNLCANKIGDEGAKALACNTTLTSLDLRSNKIGAEGAKALALNTTLTSLELACNEIGDEGAKTFIAFNTTLTRLSYDYNRLTADIEIALKNHIRNNLLRNKNREVTFVQKTIVIAQGSKQPGTQLNRLPRDLLLFVLDMVGKSEKFTCRTSDGINYMLALTLHNMAQREVEKPLTTWQTHYCHTNKKRKQQEEHIFNLHGNFFAPPKRHKNSESESSANPTQANLLSSSPRLFQR